MINGITNQRRVAKLCKLLNPLAHKVSPHNNCVTNVSPLNPCESVHEEFYLIAELRLRGNFLHGWWSVSN